MNISRLEQRVLHALAKGGAIHHVRANNRKVAEIICVSREGHIMADCTLSLFARLRKRGLIGSQDGAPYRITRLGRQSVRAQSDNQ